MPLELNILKASVVSVYDGDTATLAVKWLDLVKQSRVRFAGINAAEITSADPVVLARAQAAKDFVVQHLPIGSEVIVQSHVVDNYGRMLGTIYLKKTDTKSLNQMLIDAGLVDVMSIKKQISEIKKQIKNET